MFRSIRSWVEQHCEHRSGLEISRATHFEECVRQASGGDYNLVLLFSQRIAPGGAYTELPLENSVRAIRAIKANVATPIIAFSSNPESGEHLLSAGAEAFVTWPCQLADLAAAVDRCLERAGMNVSGTAGTATPASAAGISGPPASRLVRLRRKHDPQNLETVCIIVADEDEAFVRMMEAVIRAKYDVALTWFTSSVAAWEELQRADPDLLIVGCIWAEMTGEQIVRGLMDRKVSYPILVVSSYLSIDEERGWLPEATNISFLPKPFLPDQLYAELRKHFEPPPTEPS